MFCKVGIQPSSIPALGFTSPVTVITVLPGCKLLMPCIEMGLYNVLCNCALHFTLEFGELMECVFVLLLPLSDLGNANLSGQLVPQLGLLPNLQYL